MTANGIGMTVSVAAEDDAWPKLDPKALHRIAGEIVAVATENSEADPAAVLATLLTHAGIATGRGPRFRLADSWHHPRLFCAIVGRSAKARKGSSEAPIRRIWEAAVKAGCAPLNWRPGPMSSGEGLVAAIRDGKGEDDPGVPDKRLLIVEGELAAPLKAMQRQGNMLSTFIRTAWDGGTIEPLTKGDPIKVTDPHIGIVGHITLEELRPLLGKVELFNGFANRFLWFAARRSKLLPLAAGMSPDQVARLGRAYGGILTQARDLQEIEFCDDARDMYCARYRVLADAPGAFGAVTARAEAQIPRLALTYAVLDASPLITTQHMTAALAVWDYCDASARYIFGDAPGDPIEAAILSALASGPKATTDLYAALARHATGRNLHSALARLSTSGQIEKSSRKTSGRPAEMWGLKLEVPQAKEANYAN